MKHVCHGIVLAVALFPVQISARDDKEMYGPEEIHDMSCGGAAVKIKYMLNILRKLDSEVPTGAEATRRMVVTFLKESKSTLDRLHAEMPCRSRYVESVLNEYRELEPSFEEQTRTQP